MLVAWHSSRQESLLLLLLPAWPPPLGQGETFLFPGVDPGSGGAGVSRAGEIRHMSQGMYDFTQDEERF